MQTSEDGAGYWIAEASLMKSNTRSGVAAKTGAVDSIDEVC